MTDTVTVDVVVRDKRGRPSILSAGSVVPEWARSQVHPDDLLKHAPQPDAGAHESAGDSAEVAEEAE